MHRTWTKWLEEPVLHFHNCLLKCQGQSYTFKRLKTWSQEKKTWSRESLIFSKPGEKQGGQLQLDNVGDSDMYAEFIVLWCPMMWKRELQWCTVEFRERHAWKRFLSGEVIHWWFWQQKTWLSWSQRIRLFDMKRQKQIINEISSYF